WLPCSQSRVTMLSDSTWKSVSTARSHNILNQSNIAGVGELTMLRVCGDSCSLCQSCCVRVLDGDSPFLNKTFKTCSVVGNGGVLGNSSCGKNIDLAQFVIRCNLGTLNNGYDKHVGKKTNLISFNPSILTEHYGALIDYRRPFVNRLDLYKDALLLLPTFPYQRDTAVSLCAYYTLNDFDSSIRAVLYNPEYLRNLMTRLSTGIMMVSLGVEMCDDVQVYGFWPFPVHPNDCRPITNRYYDNRPWKRKFHVMPDEFHQLLRLHNMGVLKLHLGRCIPGRE
uniref:ST8 alpha-N-acetyl-neuraminide alpha-2,8-sialyltransferase 6 n=1 Tax=Paramormyrops kingsleyae TaxID=1676925 RepID=A0A3B3QDQ5_9TELE